MLRCFSFSAYRMYRMYVLFRVFSIKTGGTAGKLPWFNVENIFGFLQFNYYILLRGNCRYWSNDRQHPADVIFWPNSQTTACSALILPCAHISLLVHSPIFFSPFVVFQLEIIAQIILLLNVSFIAVVYF